MKIVSHYIAILELIGQTYYIINRPDMVRFLYTHTKKEFYKFVVMELATNEVIMTNAMREMIKGELWCLFEEWEIVDFVEQTWLKIDWVGINL